MTVATTSDTQTVKHSEHPPFKISTTEVSVKQHSDVTYVDKNTVDKTIQHYSTIRHSSTNELIWKTQDTTKDQKNSKPKRPEFNNSTKQIHMFTATIYSEGNSLSGSNKALRTMVQFLIDFLLIYVFMCINLVFINLLDI